jgi:hypothetical protein
VAENVAVLKLVAIKEALLLWRKACFVLNLLFDILHAVVPCDAESEVFGPLIEICIFDGGSTISFVVIWAR